MLYSNNIILVEWDPCNLWRKQTWSVAIHLYNLFLKVDLKELITLALLYVYKVYKVIFLFLWSVHSLSRDENFLNSLSTKHCRAHVSAWLWEGKAGLRCKCNEFQLHYNNAVGTTPNWQKVLSCTYFHEPEIQKSENLWIFTLFWTVCKIYKNRLEIIYYHK